MKNYLTNENIIIAILALACVFVFGFFVFKLFDFIDCLIIAGLE